MRSLTLSRIKVHVSLSSYLQRNRML